MLRTTHVFVLAVLVLYGNCEKTRCGNGILLGQWYHWRGWESCSRECGGGKQKRSRAVCCYTEGERTCLKTHGKTYSGKYEYKGCNEFCYNNGTLKGKATLFYVMYYKIFSEVLLTVGRKRKKKGVQCSI